MALRNELSRGRRPVSYPLICSLALALLVPVRHAAAQEIATTSATLLDRLAIEDALTNYYTLFGGRGNGDFGAFYTDDGVLDANGVVAKGRTAINALYKRIDGAEGGRIDILINNLRVKVTGTTATADLVWTECGSKTLTDEPHILEQGREHDELVKDGTRWRLKHRTVTNDGGLPKSLLKGYIDR